MDLGIELVKLEEEFGSRNLVEGLKRFLEAETDWEDNPSDIGKLCREFNFEEEYVDKAKIAVRNLFRDFADEGYSREWIMLNLVQNWTRKIGHYKNPDKLFEEALKC